MTAEWMNPEQAASQSGFSTKTIYRALWDGELVASKRRRRWRIRPDALTAWIEGEQRPEIPVTTSTTARRTSHQRSTQRGALGRILESQEDEAA